ncbi:hypothetical protein J2Z49_000807 [Desulfofundulus luciae]|uniref:DZANK-type domain-containing protein n=1 Tax=Desulfofundulus luciae TaxID=74702 RepID=A0ABU0AZ00_9FIRM|nr:zinc ribbon domain-containing protein [Desulfofundulus luciae]MDQ0285703.1 hypothetical protein [Desulfofundulus luciae]
MNKCPHCSFEITGEGARFCPRCGGALLPEGATEAKQPAEEKKTGDAARIGEAFGYCPHCQAPLTRPGQKFCGRCGQKILPEAETEKPGRSQKVASFQKPPLPAHPAVLQSRRAPWIILAFIVIILLAGGGFAWGYFQGYFLDTRPPQVMITSPAGDKQVVLLPGKSAQESIEIAASDNRRLKKVELFLNGALVKQFEKGEPFVYKWSTKEEGEYTFQAFAYDNCGNKSNSGPVVITAAKVEVERVAGGVADLAGEIKRIEMAIYGHYENIPDNLALAYSYFSTRYQSKVPLENWVKGFPHTISDTVDRVKVTYLSPFQATAEINLTSKDNTGEGKILIREWAGKWQLVKEWGEWKLDEPQIKKVAEYYE